MLYSPYSRVIDLVPGMQTNPHEAPAEQFWYNGCQTWTGSLLLEVEHVRAGQPIDVNRVQSYRGAQLRSGQVINNGASVDQLGSAWAADGVPTNTTFWDMYSEPTQAEKDNARQYMGVEIAGVPYIRSGPAMDNTIETIHMLLDQGHGIFGTFRMTADFDNNAYYFRNWREMNWDSSYATGGPSRGDHVVAILGIDMDYGQVMFANHWGVDWGDGGFGGAPFEKFLQGPQGCFTQLHYIKHCAVNPVGVRTVPNAFPSLLTPDQQGARVSALKLELTAAYAAAHAAAPTGTNPDIAGWLAALARGGELRCSDKEFEASAPGLNPLPRGTVREFVDRGDFAWPVGMRKEIGE